MDASKAEIKNIQQLLDRDQYLKPYEKEIRRRFVGDTLYKIWNVELYAYIKIKFSEKVSKSCEGRLCDKQNRLVADFCFQLPSQYF